MLTSIIETALLCKPIKVAKSEIVICCCTVEVFVGGKTARQRHLRGTSHGQTMRVEGGDGRAFPPTAPGQPASGWWMGCALDLRCRAVFPVQEYTQRRPSQQFWVGPGCLPRLHTCSLTRRTNCLTLDFSASVVYRKASPSRKAPPLRVPL